ncbi:hypothetical protein BJF84_16060 [Rhodococcus sp. CUA-806]|nr:hypothetical protein BJF84_16060 [Rhodococcus sp. CUA-806]
MAINELPPREKKSSSNPIRSTPSRAPNVSAIISSTGVDGGRKGRIRTVGSGSARRSSLPLGPSGKASMIMIEVGTM